MKKLRLVIIFSVIAVLGTWQLLFYTKHIYNFGREAGYEEGFKESEEGKVSWKCWDIKRNDENACPWRDWRYTKAIDVCKFEWTIVKAKENPLGEKGTNWHGYHCEQI